MSSYSLNSNDGNFLLGLSACNLGCILNYLAYFSSLIDFFLRKDDFVDRWYGLCFFYFIFSDKIYRYIDE